MFTILVWRSVVLISEMLIDEAYGQYLFSVLVLCDERRYVLVF